MSDGILFPTLIKAVQNLMVLQTSLAPDSTLSTYTVDEFVRLSPEIQAERHLLDTVAGEAVFPLRGKKPKVEQDIEDKPIGKLLKAAFKEKLSSLEESWRNEVAMGYETGVDPVDRATLDILWNGVQWAGSYIKPLIARPLQESGFWGLVDRAQYTEATRYAYDRADFYQNAMFALIRVRLAALDSMPKESRDSLVHQIKVYKAEYDRWSKRYFYTQRVETIKHYAWERYHYYNENVGVSVENLLPYHQSGQTPPQALVQETYRFMPKIASVHTELNEFYVAHNNILSDTRSPFFLQRWMEKSTDFIGTHFLVNYGYAKEARTFDELESILKSDAEKEYRDRSKIHLPLTSHENNMKEYLDYIGKDWFLYAKKFIETGAKYDPLAPFRANWQTQLKEFENYKRLVECVVMTQNKADLLMHHLTGVAVSLIDHAIYDKNLQDEIAFIRDRIALIRQSSNYLHAHRYLLKLCFMKYVKGQFGLEKETLERIADSAKHKIWRFLSEGNVFDQTGALPAQSDVVQSKIVDLWGMMKTVAQSPLCEAFEDKDDYLKNPLARAEFLQLSTKPRFFSQGLKRDTSGTPEQFVMKLQAREEEARQLKEEQNPTLWAKQEETAHTGRELMEYVLETATNLSLLQQEIEQFQCNYDQKKFKTSRLPGLIKSVQAAHHRTQGLLEQVERSIARQVRTDKNDAEGLKPKRLLKSVGRKIDRYFKTGEVLNPVPLFDEKKTEYFQTSDDVSNDYENLKSEFEKVTRSYVKKVGRMPRNRVEYISGSSSSSSSSSSK